VEVGFELKDVFTGSPRKRRIRPGRHAFRVTFRREPVYLEYRARCEDPVGDVSELLAERYQGPGKLLESLQTSSLDLVVPARPFVYRSGRPFPEMEYCDVGFATHGRVFLALVAALVEGEGESEDLLHAAAALACAPLLQVMGYRGDPWQCLNELSPVLDAPTSDELPRYQRDRLEVLERLALGRKAPGIRVPELELWIVEAVGEVEPVAAEFVDHPEMVVHQADRCFLGLVVKGEDGYAPVDPGDVLGEAEDWDVWVAVRGPIRTREDLDPLVDRVKQVRLGEEVGEPPSAEEGTAWAGLYRWWGWWRGRRFRPLRSAPMSLSRLAWFVRRVDLGMLPEVILEEVDVDVEVPTPWEVVVEGDPDEAFDAACFAGLALGFSMSLNPPAEAYDPMAVLDALGEMVDRIGERPVKEAMEALSVGVSLGSSEPLEGIRIRWDGEEVTVGWEDSVLLPWWVTSLGNIGEDVVEELVERPEIVESEEFEREYVRTALASERHALKLFRRLYEEKGASTAVSLLKLAHEGPELQFEALEWVRDVLGEP